MASILKISDPSQRSPLTPPHTSMRNMTVMPWVTLFEGADFQLLHANIEKGLWVVNTRFAPGIQISTHKHTGEVYALTLAGSWHYLEYPEINVAGSYLYEPAGSIHTLQALPENDCITEVWFAVHGANLNLDADGNVESVWDAGYMSELYLRLCSEQGKCHPDVIGL